MTAEPLPDEVGDDIDSIEFGERGPDKVGLLRSGADRYPTGSSERSAYLVVLGEHLQRQAEYDAARSAFEEALASGYVGAIHPQADLLRLALEVGDEVSVADLLRDLLTRARANALPEATYSFIGEALADFGRQRDALRWFTIPLRDFDPAYDEPTTDDVLCLRGRFRARRALGLPLDTLDQVHEELDTGLDPV